MSWGYGNGYGEYVPVAKRKAKAKAYAAKRAKKEGRKPAPVQIKGNKIAKTFWGKAWCDHLESYSDYSNRLPRGRTYARNGSVADLQISAGNIRAIVGGTDVYEITINIAKLKAAHWKKIRNDCSDSIDSLLDLLAGKFSDGVMVRLTDREEGLFPSPKEIEMDCSCPDWAGLCKHLAAVLYGVGAHLDHRPELLFLLRGVDQTELVSDAVSNDNLASAFGDPSDDLAGEDLSAMFDIDLDVAPVATDAAQKKKSRAKTKKKSTAKNTAKKKTAVTAKKKPTKKKSAKKATKKKANKKPTAKKPVENAAKTVITRVTGKKKTAKKAARKKGSRKE